SPSSGARSREKRGSVFRSSTTSGWRVTSAKPAMPVLEGDRSPTSPASPRPETASTRSVDRPFPPSRDRLEDELVRLLVEQEDRCRLGGEDRPRDVHDRREQLAVRRLVPAQHPRRGLAPPVQLVAHPSPPAFVAVRWSTLFS